MADATSSRSGQARSTFGRLKPSLGPPKVVVHGAWGRALPAPLPGEKEGSIFTSWLMGLLGKPHPRALAEQQADKAARR